MKLMNNGGGQWKYFDLDVRLFTSFDQLCDKYSVSIPVCGPWSVTQKKYYFNLYEFLKQKIHALVEKLENRCFCQFLAAILVSLKKTPPWRFHTKLHKFGYNVCLNISHLKYCTDLILGEAYCIFIFFHFADSRLFVLNGLHQFIFHGGTGQTKNIPGIFPRAHLAGETTKTPEKA